MQYAYALMQYEISYDLDINTKQYILEHEDVKKLCLMLRSPNHLSLYQQYSIDFI